MRDSKVAIMGNFDNSLSMTDVDLVPKSCKVEIIPFCEKSPMAAFYPNSPI